MALPAEVRGESVRSPKRLLGLSFVPYSADAALLLLRVWAGTSLFLKHGWEKPTTFAQMAAHFPDPLYIGPVPSLMFALVSDAVCSLLVAAGLMTRWAALWICVNLTVAWSLVHHFQFLGRGTDHGEAMVLYLGVYMALAIAGPGRYSLDHRLLSGS